MRFVHQGRQTTLSTRLLKNEWSEEKSLISYKIVSILPDDLVSSIFSFAENNRGKLILLTPNPLLHRKCGICLPLLTFLIVANISI